jgi:hypothetical protein
MVSVLLSKNNLRSLPQTILNKNSPTIGIALNEPFDRVKEAKRNGIPRSTSGTLSLYFTHITNPNQDKLAKRDSEYTVEKNMLAGLNMKHKQATFTI